MALITDGMISGIEDLQSLDSSILQVAQNEGIDLGVKLEAAEQAVQLQVAAQVLKMRPYAITSSLNGGYDLSHVVVTPALRLWHSLSTLAEVYADAYNSQLNDRYRGKWTLFLQKSMDALALLLDVGIGIVSFPIPRAAKPILAANGTGGPTTSYVVRTAWRSAQGDSGACSEPAALNAPSGQLFTVDAGPAPAGAVGFDVYLGMNGATPVQQNLEAIPAGELWPMPASGAINGAPVTDGQAPDFFVRRFRTL